MTNNELTCLAYLLAERQIDTSEDWLEWEDMPEMGQYDFEDLQGKMDVVVNYLRDARRLMEITWKIDSQLLLERVS